MGQRTFYDVHIHAFNLSHPSFTAFLFRVAREVMRRFAKWRHVPRTAAIIGLSLVAAKLWLLFALVYAVPPLRKLVRLGVHQVAEVIKKHVRAILNMLSVLENDIGSFFLLTENCLREVENPLLRHDNRLYVGGAVYDRIVLTPLMIDFGTKGKTYRRAPTHEWSYHYSAPAGKPIVEQVSDVFAAIQIYVNAHWTPRLQATYPSLTTDAQRLFKIYPFLGLNPANYTAEELDVLLEKYFGAYAGTEAELEAHVGAFAGDVGALTSGFFAGIKLYPPLGFDPWPDHDEERVKVVRLYRFASGRGVPITVHGGTGGFRVVDRDTARDLAAVSKWSAVLSSYPDLKLNLAHFPVGLRERRRGRETLDLVLRSKSVYVDISCRAVNQTYYEGLRSLLDGLPPDDRGMLRSRLLFGSDFAVNLLWVDSYNQYVDLFSRTPFLSADEKLAMCSTNPEAFLFRAVAKTPGRP